MANSSDNPTNSVARYFRAGSLRREARPGPDAAIITESEDWHRTANGGERVRYHHKRLSSQRTRSPPSAVLCEEELDGSRARRSAGAEGLLAGRPRRRVSPRPFGAAHARGARVRRRGALQRRDADRLPAQPPRLRPRSARHASVAFQEGARRGAGAEGLLAGRPRRRVSPRPF